MLPAVPTPPDPDLLEEALSVLERSKTFARAGSQVRLLRFLAERALSHPERSLRETDIGCGFFQREPAYDTGNDAIVRVSLNRLRSKLERYYEDEGREQPVRLSIPVGSYSLRIERLQMPEQPQTASPEAAQAAVPATLDPPRPEQGRPKHRVRFWFLLPIAAVLAVCLAIGVPVLRAHLPQSSWLNGPLQFKPVTLGDGSEAFPAFSPDGRRIVYSGRTPDAVAYSLYIRLVSSVEPGRKVPTPTGDALHPAWSPDGKSIAYLLAGPHDSAIEVVDLASGISSQAARLPWYSLLGENVYNDSRVPGPVWTADGTGLIFALRVDKDGPERFVLQQLATGRRTALTTGDADEEDGTPAVSPDGRTLAFIRRRTPSDTDIDLLDLRTMALRTLAPKWGPVDGLTWNPSGEEVVASSDRDLTGRVLWRIPLQGAPSVLTTEAREPREPAMAPRGELLALISVHHSSNIVAVSTLGSASAARLIFPSNERTEQVTISPDGRLLAFLSDRSGKMQLWLARLEGGKPVDPGQVTADLPARPLYLAWAPDSRRLALALRGEGQNGIRIVDPASGRMTLLQTPCLDAGVVPLGPVWSEDGGAIVFSIIHGAQSGVYRAGAGAGPSCERLSQVVTHKALPDGHGGFFLTAPRGAGILHVAPGSNTPVPVAGLEDAQPDDDWTVQNGAILYIDLRSPVRTLDRYDPATGHIETLSPPLERVNFTGLSYSPALHLLLFHQRSDTFESQIVALMPRAALPTN